MPTSTLGQRVEHAHLAFTLAVHRALTGSAATNACWSPYSVASALGLAATGARGATRDELVTLLMGSADGDLAEHGAMLVEAASLTPANPNNPPVLDVANTMWHSPQVAIQPEFARELSGWPTAAVREAPFRTDPDGARRQINADVSHTTHRLIPELLRPGVIKTDTGATLVNALYLKVAWANRFPARGTTPEAFHSPSGTTDVPTMRLNKRLSYAAADDWQVVVLPAAGDVQGIVLLPDGDLATAEADLSADALAGLLDAPTPAALDLHLPKFRVRADASLDDALTALGVRTMFGDSADFGGISDTWLAIDTVVHEAVLTVDELGLEGAAATAAVARMLSMQAMPSRPVVVRVDRPFLFLVRHRSSGAVYFLSRVVRP